MFSQSPKAAYLLSLYFGLLVLVRLGSEWFIRNFVVSLGFGEDEVLRFVFDNEMNLQAFCLIVTLATCAWLSRLEWFQLSTLLQSLKRFFVVTSYSELSVLFLESVFRGFMVSSCVIGLSVFLGYSVLEVPAFSEVAWFQLLPALATQGFLLLIWISLIEMQRFFIFKAWTERSLPNSAESLVSRFVVVGFESFFYFWILNSSFFWLDRFYLALLCVLMAAGQMLWFELTYRPDLTTKFSIRTLRRVFVLFSFSFSLIHIFGQSVGGFKRVSWMSSFPGPLREPTGNLAMSSPAGQVLFALLLVFSVNVLIHKYFKESSSNR